MATAVQNRDLQEALTRHQAAAFLRISVRSLDYWIASGRVKAYKVGQRTFVFRDDLTAVLQPKTPHLVQRKRGAR